MTEETKNLLAILFIALAGMLTGAVIALELVGYW
jgi:hypothetical protein